MEFSFSDEPKKGGTPATKLYSPKKKAANRAETAAKGRSRSQNGAAADASLKREPQQLTAMSRIGIMLSGFLFAGMILFTLAGYERISRAYADVNTINSAIDAAELRIKALDVQIECAVTIQDAQETAENYGMQYPTQSQYVRIGGSIPISGAAPSGLGPGETVAAEQPDAPAATDAPTATDAPDEDTPSDD